MTGQQSGASGGSSGTGLGCDDCGFGRELQRRNWVDLGKTTTVGEDLGYGFDVIFGFFFFYVFKYESGFGN